jgi:hypothetical protein
MRNGSIRAVVDGTGDTLPDFCRRLMAAGLDPDLRLDVYRDVAPSFGVKSLHAGQFEHSFDEILLAKENDMRSDQSDPNSGIPRLKVAAAPLPRGNLPPHVTPGEVETGADDDIGPEVIPHILKLCAENGISTDVPLGDALEQLSDRIAAAGDAGVPTGRVGAVDAEGLDGEVIEQIMQHLDGRLSPAALEQLKDMLEGGPDEYDWMPPGLRDKGSRDQLERMVEHLDPHSASDALENIEAIELMRQQGNLERGPRMTERRDGPWHPGKGEPPGSDLPRPAGKLHPPGSLVPSEHHKLATDSRMPKVKAFHKVIGVKKRHLPGVL